MHDNPRATEEEQELARTERMDEEEAMRGPQPSTDDGKPEKDADSEEE